MDENPAVLPLHGPSQDDKSQDSPPKLQANREQTPSDTASVSEPSEQVSNARRVRQSKPKVKTGCSNCKQRRIKCDEQRPECSQCMKSKRACPGYPAPSRGSRPLRVVTIAPKPAATTSQEAPPMPSLAPRLPPQSGQQSHATHSVDGHSPHGLYSDGRFTQPPAQETYQQLTTTGHVASRHEGMRHEAALLTMPYTPSTSLHLDDSQVLYFDIFRNRTASELSGYFDHEFWTRSVLQECHNESAIRHAVIALGALYMILDMSHTKSRSSSELSVHAQQPADTISKHWQVAVRQYSEACTLMMRVSQQDNSGYRTRLMACVLLACFDSFIGDHKQAITQIQTGLGLLDRVKVKQFHQAVPSSELGAEDELTSMLQRLGVQAKSYDMAFHFPQPYVIRVFSPDIEEPTGAWSPIEAHTNDQSAIGGLPAHFQTPQEARHASDRLHLGAIRIIEKMQANFGSPENMFPSSWESYARRLQRDFDAWLAAYEGIMQSRHTCAQVSERVGIPALQMCVLSAKIIFSMMFCPTESGFDAYFPTFKDIVSLGFEAVNGGDGQAAAADQCADPALCTHGRAGHLAPHTRPSFAADLGIVPPLFTVATKCRQPVLRRQAIQLLRSSARREGMWDSELAASIGEWIMVKEEGVQSPNTTPYQIPVAPDERRVQTKAVDFDLRSRSANLTVGSRNVPLGQHDDRLMQTQLSW